MYKYLEFIRTKKFFIIILLTIILIIFNSIRYNNILYTLGSDNSQFKEEYESLNDDRSVEGKQYPEVNLNLNFNEIKYLNIEEVLDILYNGTGVIYIGYAECIYCRSAIQVLTDTAKDLELEVIYYLDINKVWGKKELDENNNVITVEEASPSYDKLLERLGEEYTEPYILKSSNGDDIETEAKRPKIPLVLFVVDGNIVSSNVGTLFSQEDPYQALDDDQIKGLSEIYSYGIKDVLEGLQNNSN